VIEAGFKSGALNTASQALELGRVVAAVPGPIDSEQSNGSNQLLRDGAVMIASPDDALALLGVTPAKDRPIPTLPENEQRVWNALDRSFLEVDALATKSDLSIPDCFAAITSLEIMGLIDCSAAGEIRRR
jgi:DNA processing protein